MKTAIIYYSRHHGNTKKLIDALAAAHDVTAIDVSEAAQADLTGYDAIGLASGIYYSRFHRSMLDFARNHLPAGKPVFFLYTYGAKKDGYTRAITQAVQGAQILGGYGCLGFNTFGPFKLFGGMAKGHPNEDELRAAVAFYDALSL